ncbi:hypothetical protein WJX72_006600 [[Myrmecia] bisecta]|uniref:Transcription initiation factor TFIID subunit 11 n=1 Tax=[Myrmecia] bisecta TaxID=41462 RepID=A0AAW1QRW7_9CHLO
MKRSREELEEEEDDLAADLEAALEEGEEADARPAAEEPVSQGWIGTGITAQPLEEPAEADAGAGAPLSEAAQQDKARAERNRLNQQILQMLTPEQIDRYEAYRRSSLNRRNMKRLIQSVTGQVANPNTIIVMCGVAKMFLGDLIEAGRAIAHEQGDTGPLRPSHIHAAYQQLDKQGHIPHQTAPKRLRL